MIDGIQLNMDEYIDGIHLTEITAAEEDRSLTEEEASEYRSIVRRLPGLTSHSLS